LSEKFIDDKITHIESDIKKIQVKPSMYIGPIGSRAALHLCFELINNAIDECINTNSPGDTVSIILDETENTITVSDNGRGINEKDIEIVCTTLQSGSKFTREGTGEGSAGENGVGLTACNALSERFEIIVTRYGQKTSIGFTEGELTSPVSTKKIKDTSKHGTTFIIKPSKKYLGDDCDIPGDRLMSWIEKIIYITPQEITINLSIKKKGKDAIVTKKYKNKNGLYDYCKKLTGKASLDPVHLKASKRLKENFHGREIERFLGLEFAFTYDSDNIEFVADSFCNFVNTVQNGTHVDGVRQALVQVLSKSTRDTITGRDSKDLDIIANDVLQGLTLTVYLSTTINPMFTGQIKDTVGNPELTTLTRTMTIKMLNQYFNENPKELKKCCDRIKLNAKGRLEANKARKAVIKGEVSNLDEHLIENFIPCNNRGKNDYRELFIIEGKSARGSASMGRYDRDTQAIYNVRGVPLNSLGVRIDKLLANEEFRDLVKVMKCNIGQKFDITKLYYNKIIIMADSDSDGFNITSLLCAFFMAHFPELVKAGYIYKAVAPLYELFDKKHRFVRNKEEYINVFEGYVRKAVVVYDIDTNEALDDSELASLLMINRPYLELLTNTANHFAVPPLLLDYILINRKKKNFYKDFKRKYPEMTIDENNRLMGVLDGKYYRLDMNKSFEKQAAKLNKFIFETNKKTHYKIKERSDDGLVDKGIMSIGEFMTSINKFTPPIKTRFKGLGELDPVDLRETTLDPDKRILIQLTSEDMDREMDIFDMLHGNNAEGRKEFMKNSIITREELDN
jgi:DNA gyrase subunit B